MQFNPKIGFILGILVTIEIAVAGGTLSLTNAIPAAWIPTVQAWAAILASIGSAALTILHGYSNGQTGPLVPDASFDKTVKAVDTAVKDLGSLKSQAQSGTLAQGPKVALMLAIGLAALALWAGPAQAQQPRPFVPTGNLPKDIAATRAPAGLAASPGEPALDQLWSKVIGAALEDLKYAKALSDAVNTPGSLARGECWSALIKANEDAQGKSLRNADGTPMVKPSPDLFTSVEQLGEVIDNLAPTGPVFLGCSKAATMLKVSVLQFINAAVAGAAGISAIAGVT